MCLLAVAAVGSSLLGQESIAGAPRDRSDDIALAWVADYSEAFLTRDSSIFLEVRNVSDEAIPFAALVYEWRKLWLAQEGVRPLAIGQSFGDFVPGQSSFSLPAGLALHLPVRFRYGLVRNLQSGEAYLTGDIRVDATDVLLPPGYHSSGPTYPGIGGPYALRPLSVVTEFRVRLKSEALRIHWVRRDQGPRDPTLPPEWESWQQALDNIHWLTARSGGMLELRGRGARWKTKSLAIPGYPEASRSWRAAVGRRSRIPNADDLACDLATNKALAHWPEERDRWLDWVVREHPNSSGGTRARELTRWLARGEPTQVYLAFSSRDSL